MTATTHSDRGFGCHNKRHNNLEFPHRGDEANGQLPKEVLQSAVKVVERAAAAVLLGSADGTGSTDTTCGADIISSKDLRMKVGDVAF